jgi:hypothetical protein
LTLLEQLCLIDYYFCRGNKYIKESVDEVVQTTLAGAVVSSDLPRSSNGILQCIQVGNIYYHFSIVDLKDKAMAVTQPQVTMFMEELLTNVKNKKDRLLNINNVYSSMHISSELERKKFYQIEEGEQSASVTESYVSYKDFHDLSHSLIRDSVLLELIKRCGELGCYKSEEQDGE